MNLQINEQYRITSDAYNVSVEERKVAGDEAKNPGEVRWVAVSHHNNLFQASMWLINRNINTSGAITLHDVVSEIQKSRNELIQAIETREHL